MINILAGLSWCCAAPMSKYPVVNPSGNTPGIPAARASAPWLGRLFSAKLPLAALTKKVPVVLAMKLKFLTIPEVEPELLLYAPQFNMVVPAPLTSRKPNAEFASANSWSIAGCVVDPEFTWKPSLPLEYATQFVAQRES